MKHASLFSGIGGFDLAAEWAGWSNVLHCEKNEFCQKVLNYYWPKAKLFTDVTTANFKPYRGKIDVLTGGFPCQPFSTAGKRLGTEDDRHLWPEMLRAIREIQPRWIVGENVYGLVNWSGGLVFEQVCADLEAEGYEIQPIILPAASKNAPHRRDRIWFVAYRPDPGVESLQGRKDISGGFGDATDPQKERSRESGITWKRGAGSEDSSCDRDATNAKRTGQSGQGWAKGCSGTEKNSQWQASWVDNEGGWPTQSPVCSRDDGIPTELDRITFSKHRKESLMAYGNAVVPQIPFEIFKTINTIEQKWQYTAHLPESA